MVVYPENGMKEKSQKNAFLSGKNVYMCYVCVFWKQFEKIHMVFREESRAIDDIAGRYYTRIVYSIFLVR